MIDFKEEVAKYKPILSVDEIETSIETDEIRDMMDLLQHITNQINDK